MIRVLGLCMATMLCMGLFAQTPQLGATLNQVPSGDTTVWRLQWQSSIMSDTAVIEIVRTRPTGGFDTLLRNAFGVTPEAFNQHDLILESTENEDQVYTITLTEFKNGATGFLEGRAIFENVMYFVEPDCPECICPSLFSPVVDFEEDDLNITVRVLNLNEIQTLADGRSLEFKLITTGPLGSMRSFQSNIGNFAFEATDGDGVYECMLTYELDGEASFASSFNVSAAEKDKRVVIPRVSGVGAFETILTLNRLAQQTRLRLTLHSDLGFSASVNFDLFSYNQFDDRAVAIDVGTIFGELAGPLEIQEEANTLHRRFGQNRIVARSFIFTTPTVAKRNDKRELFADLFTTAGKYLVKGTMQVPNLPENAGWIAYMDAHDISYELIPPEDGINNGIQSYTLSKHDLQKMEEQPTTVIWSAGLFLDDFDPTRGVHARVSDHESPFDGEWLVALNLSNQDGRFDVRLNNRSVDSITLLPHQSSLIHLTTRDDGIDRPGFFQIITNPTELAQVQLRSINSSVSFVYGIITVSGGALAVQPY